MTDRRIVSAVHVVHLPLSPLPPLGIVALRTYAGTLDGMGSWAVAASMGPWLIGASARLGLAAIGIAGWRLRRGLAVTTMLIGATLSGSVATSCALLA